MPCFAIQHLIANPVLTLYLQLRETYLKKEAMVNRSQTYDAIRKLLAVLDDPFTRFLEPSRLAALRRGTAGAVGAAAVLAAEG
jgi:C-terminal processing protease CtpA/Prc